MSTVGLFANPAEQFAAGFDGWFAGVAVDDLDAWSDRHYRRIRELAEMVARIGDASPVHQLLHGGPENSYVALAALDRALARCHPLYGQASELDHIADLYRVTGSLIRPDFPPGGGLVPRWVHPNSGDGLTDRRVDAFRYVRRVSMEHWGFLRPRTVDPLDDLVAGSRSSYSPLRIGFVPVMLTLADIHVAPGVGVPGLVDASSYSLGPAKSLAERVPFLLQELDQSGCDIAVCPEGALDPALMQAWQEAIKSNPRGPGSKLTWILLGSGRHPSASPQRPFNRAVMIARETGEELLCHDKFAPFNFGTETQINNWAISDALGQTPPIYENIRRGDCAQVLESRAGRLVVMICEDLTRAGHEVYEAIRAVGPALVLTPVFARVTRQHRWEHLAADQWWRSEGTSVAVVNSLVVPHAEFLRDKDRGLIEDPGDLPHGTPYCLLLAPSDWSGEPMGRADGEHVVVRELS